MDNKVDNDDNSVWKRFQRVLLTSVSKRFSCYLFSFILILSVSIIFTSISIGLHFFSVKSIPNDTDYCSHAYRNNIGHRSFADQLCYPTIDAVYTWVNGSDPTWIKEMLYYKNLEKNNTQLSEEELQSILSSYGENRFRDNDELKYSLRSIEKFAPWIRKVFIVTNGQVPDWLDANHPKVQIIPHELIFPNKSVLPTFSSSAIEMNLHRIPGLSEHFIYFNDDVFLGQPVYPYDFYTLEKGQIMYFSWDVPSCSDRCLYENLGDGYCDEGCFNPQCGFDLGDCSDREYIPHADKIKEPATIVTQPKGPKERCAEGCPFLWIGDGSCDRKCNVEECGYDAYDCSESENDLLNSTFVHFLTMKPSSNQHPVFEYINKTFLQHGLSYQEGMTFYLGRVLVDTTSSYSSIKLTDLLRLDLHIKTIEVEDDTMIYSSIYKSFFNELIIVWSKEGKKSNSFFSIQIVITANTSEGVSYTVYLEIMRFSFAAIPSFSQLHSYQYNNIKNISDESILTKTQDTLFCSTWNDFSQSSSLYLIHSIQQDSIYFIQDKQSLQLLPSYDIVPVLPEFIPSVSSTDYIGNLQDKIVHSKQSSFTSLPIHSKQEIETFINQSPLNKQYRKLCYGLFLQQAQSLGYVDSTMILNTTIPYLIPSELFPNKESYPSKLLNHNHKIHFFSTFNELTSEFATGEGSWYYAKPVNRTVFCQIDPSLLWKNEYYHKRMENMTFIDGVLLRDVNHEEVLKKEKEYEDYKRSEMNNEKEEEKSEKEEEKSEEQSSPSPSPSPSPVVYRFTKESIHSLKYHITKTDQDQDISIHLTIPISFIQQNMENQCPLSSLSSSLLSKEFIQDHIHSLDLTDSDVIHQIQQTMNITSLTELENILNTTSGRRLADTYSDSLIYTNILLTKLFGNEERKVPAHMPHFMNVISLQQIEQKIPDYFTETRSHRFRSSNDLQFALMYFYFVKQFEKEKQDDYYNSLWNLYLDTDHDGYLNANELQTLAAIVYQDNINDENIRALYDCLSPETEEVEEFTIGNQQFSRVTKKREFVTFESYKKCTTATKPMQERFRFNPRFTTLKDNAVAFEMINDDIEETKKKLYSIRKRQSKFICINDNVKHMTEELQNELHEFYESFFPYPSQFERGNHTALYIKSTEQSFNLVWIIAGLLICGIGILLYLVMFL